MKNWRLLESEIIDVLREAGVPLTEDKGDKLIDLEFELPELNVTDFAKALAERVEVIVTPIGSAKS